ncbi:UDP-glucuronosyltransferase 1-1 [Homalodisca vitripennis]|nr:UDP-glucuronosyltransferase 1-1 [Homalodisca vitripennis]
MKKFIDDAKDGVIYFSLGSVVPDHVLGKEFFDMFTKAFQKLPQRVLWKTGWKHESLPNNVKTANWMPQQDILVKEHFDLMYHAALPPHQGCHKTIELDHVLSRHIDRQAWAGDRDGVLLSCFHNLFHAVSRNNDGESVISVVSAFEHALGDMLW